MQQYASVLFMALSFFNKVQNIVGIAKIGQR